jgi:hypothetical protein
VIQNALAGWLPVWLALVVTAVVFGIAHWVTTAYAVVAGVVGLYLGLLYLRTENLLAPAVAHALYDFVALLVIVRLKPAPSASVV